MASIYKGGQEKEEEGCIMVPKGLIRLKFEYPTRDILISSDVLLLALEAYFPKKIELTGEKVELNDL